MIGIPEEEKTEWRNIGILAKNFPEFMIDTKTKIKGAQRIASKINK